MITLHGSCFLRVGLLNAFLRYLKNAVHHTAHGKLPVETTLPLQAFKKA